MFQASSEGRLTVEVRGYCALAALDVLRRFSGGGPEAVTDLAGEYAVVVSDNQSGERWIVTSPHGAVNYFYAHDGARLHHGPTVLAVLEQARMDWRWNWTALADVLSFEHVLGDDTLHPLIRRMPAASILRWQDGRVSIRTT